MKYLFIIFFLLTLTSQAHASEVANCDVFYGGGEMCRGNSPLSVDKKIMKPSNNKGGGEYVDNLTDPRFNQGDQIVFQITVKNTGNNKIEKISVVDYLAQELTYIAGDGKYDAPSKRFTATIPILEKGASKTFLVTTQVENANTAVECPKNEVKVIARDGTFTRDSASFCLARTNTYIPPNRPNIYGNTNPRQIPNTGAEAAILPLLAAAGAAGFYLRRKTL